MYYCHNLFGKQVRRNAENIVRKIKYYIEERGIRKIVFGDDEFMDLLRIVNTQQLSLAIENASPRLQNKIQKNLNIKKAKQNIEKLSKDIITTGLFIVGFPKETYEEAFETISFAEELTYVA